MTTEQSCVFCRIVRGEIPSYTVYQDSVTLAFLDINPVARGHTLVIPRKHVPDVYALDDETANAVMHSTVRVAKLLRKALAQPGLTVLERNGRAAGQTIEHFHFNLVPRAVADSVDLTTEGHRGSASDLEAVSAKLRAAAG